MKKILGLILCLAASGNAFSQTTYIRGNDTLTCITDSELLHLLKILNEGDRCAALFSIEKKQNDSLRFVTSSYQAALKNYSEQNILKDTLINRWRNTAQSRAILLDESERKLSRWKKIGVASISTTLVLLGLIFVL